MQFYISGSLAYDRILSFDGKFKDHILPDKIHILNVSFMVNGMKENFGGTAGNIAYSLALLGEKPLVLSTVGKDFEQYSKWMNKHDLSLEGIRIIEDDFTAGAYITTDQTNCQITGFNPGTMKFPSEFDFNGACGDSCLGLISPGNLADMLEYCRYYKKHDIPFIFDPGQQIPVLSAEEMVEMISGCLALVTNDYELEMIMQATGMSRGDILQKAEFIITTLGEHGCKILRGAESWEVPAVPVSEVCDPTGAGDAFRSGLLKGLSDGKPMHEAAKVAAVAAAYAVENYGTQEHAYTQDEFWQRYAQSFDEYTS